MLATPALADENTRNFDPWASEASHDLEAAVAKVKKGGKTAEVIAACKDGMSGGGRGVAPYGSFFVEMCARFGVTVTAVDLSSPEVASVVRECKRDPMDLVCSSVSWICDNVAEAPGAAPPNIASMCEQREEITAEWQVRRRQRQADDAAYRAEQERRAADEYAAGESRRVEERRANEREREESWRHAEAVGELALLGFVGSSSDAAAFGGAGTWYGIEAGVSGRNRALAGGLALRLGTTDDGGAVIDAGLDVGLGLPVNGGAIAVTAGIGVGGVTGDHVGFAAEIPFGLRVSMPVGSGRLRVLADAETSLILGDDPRQDGSDALDELGLRLGASLGKRADGGRYGLFVDYRQALGASVVSVLFGPAPVYHGR